MTKLQLQNLEQTFVKISININNTTASRCWNLQRTESHQSILLNRSLLVCYKGRQSNSGSMKNHLFLKSSMLRDRPLWLHLFELSSDPSPIIVLPCQSPSQLLSQYNAVTKREGRLCCMLLICFCLCCAVAMRLFVAKSQQLRVCTKLVKVLTCNQSFYRNSSNLFRCIYYTFTFICRRYYIFLSPFCKRNN